MWIADRRYWGASFVVSGRKSQPTIADTPIERVAEVMQDTITIIVSNWPTHRRGAVAKVSSRPLAEELKLDIAGPVQEVPHDRGQLQDLQRAQDDPDAGRAFGVDEVTAE